MEGGEERVEDNGEACTDGKEDIMRKRKSGMVRRREDRRGLRGGGRKEEGRQLEAEVRIESSRVASSGNELTYLL